VHTTYKTLGKLNMPTGDREIRDHFTEGNPGRKSAWGEENKRKWYITENVIDPTALGDNQRWQI
jgi:hypothetical protein